MQIYTGNDYLYQDQSVTVVDLRTFFITDKDKRATQVKLEWVYPIGPNPEGWINSNELSSLVPEGAQPTCSFSEALEHIVVDGEKVARKGWNGKGMFIFLVPGSTFTVNRPPLLGIYPEGTEINYQPHIDMKTADGSIVPWLASQSDILATDWIRV